MQPCPAGIVSETLQNLPAWLEEVLNCTLMRHVLLASVMHTKKQSAGKTNTISGDKFTYPKEAASKCTTVVLDIVS